MFITNNKQQFLRGACISKDHLITLYYAVAHMPYNESSPKEFKWSTLQNTWKPI